MYYIKRTIGIVQGLIFGIIDNFGMALGIDSIQEVLNIKNTTVTAGLGNLYSSVFGSVMGSSLEKAIKNKTDIDNTPWWGNLVGIVLGSLVGIGFGYLLQNKDDKIVDKKGKEIKRVDKNIEDPPIRMNLERWGGVMRTIGNIKN